MGLIDLNAIITAVMTAGVIGAISTYGITKAISVHIVYINQQLQSHNEEIKNIRNNLLTCKKNGG